MSEFVPQRKPWLRWLLVLGGALVVVGVMVWVVSGLMEGKGEKRKQPPKISILPDRPPPPPPPPKEEKKEPPKEQKEQKIEAPKQEPQPAQNEPLKMEGQAGDGPSAFGSGQVRNEDLSRIGGEGNGSGSVFGAYAWQVKRVVEQYLAKRNDLRRSQYRADIHVWFAADGSVARSQLANSTGNDKLDEAIRAALTGLPPAGAVPPANMPQPIRLRLTSSTRG